MRAAEARRAASIRSRSSMMLSAGVFVDPHENLAVREPRYRGLAERNIQEPRDFRAEIQVRRTAEKLETVSRNRQSVHLLQPQKLNGEEARINCPRWIRTTITGSKDRCPAIGRGGNRPES